jgi:hypothetical protein
VSGLVWLRLAGFLRTGRVLAPVLAALVLLAAEYGGGAAQAGEAYGVSAVLLFPILAWQTKLLLDAEPDTQRRLALVATGQRRDLAAGLLAGAAMTLPLIVLAMGAPWLTGGISGPVEPGHEPLAAQLLVGAWAHLLAVPAAVGLGALASRAVTRAAAYGVVVLAVGGVCTLVLGLRTSAAPWLVPPLMAAARVARAPEPAALLGVTAHALVWTAAAMALYAWLRRSRT